MREIICAQIGQCGNNIGEQFWRTICDEHHISPNDGQSTSEAGRENDKVGVYFDEAPGGRYVPRALLIDLDRGPLDHIRAGPSGSLYRPDNFVNGREGASNNWARAHYTDGAELFEPVCDALRHEAEQCDCLQGVQLIHSIGGGTGSGFGCLLTNRFREEYPDRMLNSYSVFPSKQISDVVVEPYNAVLTLHHLIDDVDMCHVLDNQALYSIATNVLRIRTPTNAHLNRLVSQSMSGTSSCLRYPGQLNADLRKLAVNMVPFPRLHFFTPSIAPLCAADSISYQIRSVAGVVEQLFSKRNSLADCDPTHGRYLTAAAIFRGDISMRDIEQHLDEYSRFHVDRFADWLPNNIKLASCRPAGQPNVFSASFLGNTTAIHESIKQLCNDFSIMFRRKAFVHWYLAEGMETMEFIEAESNVLDLSNEYKQFESAKTESSPSIDEDEEEQAAASPSLDSKQLKRQLDMLPCDPQQKVDTFINDVHANQAMIEPVEDYTYELTVPSDTPTTLLS